MCKASENGILQLQIGQSLGSGRDGSFILAESISAIPLVGKPSGTFPFWFIVGDDGLVTDFVQNFHPMHAVVLGDNGMLQSFS